MGCLAIITTQCICFDNEQSAQNPMCQYWCSGEGLLQHVESRAAFVGELPSRAFAGEAGEQDSDVRVMWNKMLVEISKPQEGLYVFNLVGFRPILNDLDLVSGSPYFLLLFVFAPLM